MAGVFHALDHRTVPPRRFSEHRALGGIREGAIAVVDLRDDFSDEMVGVIPDRRGVDVLIAAEPRPAIGKYRDHRTHGFAPNQALQAFGNALLEGLPAHMGGPRAHEPSEIDENRETPVGHAIVFRREVDGDGATVGVSECVAPQHRRIELELLQPAAQRGSELEHARIIPAGSPSC